MITETQNKIFRKAIEALNCGSEIIDEADIIASELVTVTRDTVADFIAARGNPNESEEFFGVTLLVWRNVQSRKGARRGDLYVVDYGDARAARFDGEV